MSALNVFLRKDAVHFLSDGAACDTKGVLIGNAPKVRAYPHLRAMIGVLGTYPWHNMWAESASDKARSFDDLLLTFPTAFRDNVEGSGPHFKLKDFPLEWSVFLAGWSESRDCPEAYIMTNLAGRSDEFPPGELHPLAVYLSPMTPELRIRLDELSINPGDRDLDPATDGLRILQEQRRTKVAPTAVDTEGYFVGSFAQLTTLTPDSITTRVLEHWPDKIGERINP